MPPWGKGGCPSDAAREKRKVYAPRKGKTEKYMGDYSLEEREHISLCEVLDRILNKGAVVVGEVTLSVANIDLVYLGLQVILTSIETAREILTPIRDVEMSNEFSRIAQGRV